VKHLIHSDEGVTVRPRPKARTRRAGKRGDRAAWRAEVRAEYGR